MGADARRVGSGRGVEPESYARLVGDLLGVVGGLAVLGYFLLASEKSEPKPAVAVVETVPAPKAVVPPTSRK